MNVGITFNGINLGDAHDVKIEWGHDDSYEPVARLDRMNLKGDVTLKITPYGRRFYSELMDKWRGYSIVNQRGRNRLKFLR